MKEILLTNKNIAPSDNGIFVFDIRQNRKMRYKILAWLDGEHGEEIILSNAIQEALRGCARTGKDIAFDVRDFSQFGYNFSYLNSVFEHVAFEECKEEADRIERAIFFNITICVDKVNPFNADIAYPHEVVVNQSFESIGNSTAKRFTKFLKEHVQSPFGEYIINLAEKKGVFTRSQICMASGISKYTMSKLVNGITRPSRDTLAALAIGLKLNQQEAEEMYNQVGYHLGNMDIVDQAVKFFISEKIYDIDIVNYCLYCHGLEPLGEKPREDKIDRSTNFD